MDNLTVVDYLIDRLSRRLRKEKLLLDFERVILKLLRNLLKAPSKQEIKMVFSKGYSTLKHLQSHTPNVYGLEECLYWTESRMTGRKIVAVIGETL